MAKEKKGISSNATISDLRKAIKVAEDNFPVEFRDDIRAMRRELARRVNHPSAK